MASCGQKISVGVVIPVHDRPREVMAAIESVLAQSRQPDQIVVVDDASSTPVRLPAGVAGSANIRLISLNENCGAAGARQAGIEALETSHVAFLDSDDVWLPNKFELQTRQLGEASNSDLAVVCCGWRYKYDNGEIGGAMIPVDSSNVVDFASGCWFSPGSTAIVSKRMFQGIGGFDKRLRRLEDLDLFIRHALAGGRLDVIPSAQVVIAKGGRGRVADVERAAAIILEKYAGSDSPLGSVGRKCLAAWLNVERAAAAKNEGRLCKASGHLFRSMLNYPRCNMHLKNWWIEASEWPESAALGI